MSSIACIFGTFPGEPGTVVEGPVTVAVTPAAGEQPAHVRLRIGARDLPCGQGSAALCAAAARVVAARGAGHVYAVLGGDIGHGDGTRAVYAALPAALARAEAAFAGEDPAAHVGVVAFHYLQPIMALMRSAVETVRERLPEAALVADAGGMYAARASGLSGSFELMTPDIGEIGFLAEPHATHPAYVARFLFGQDDFDVPVLIDRAYELGTASRVLIVKGATDYVAVATAEPHIIATVSEPDVPMLEAMGGTGDTVTGAAVGLLAADVPTEQAAEQALVLNRTAGKRCNAQVYYHVDTLIAAFTE